MFLLLRVCTTNGCYFKGHGLGNACWHDFDRPPKGL